MSDTLSDNAENSRESKNPDKIRRLSLQEAVTLFGISSSIGYLASFMFEAGYCRAFLIPNGFIAITPQSVFIVAGAFLLTGLVFLNWGTWFFHKLYFAFRRHYFEIAPTLLAAAAATFLFSFLVRPWLLWLFDIALLTITVRRAGRKDSDQPEAWQLIPILVGAKIGETGLACLVAILFALSLPYYFGKVEAHRSDWRLASDTPERYTIVRIYGDTILTMPQVRNGKSYAVTSTRLWPLTLTYPTIHLSPQIKLFHVGDKDVPTFSQQDFATLNVDLPVSKYDVSMPPLLSRIIGFLFY